jgi:hypothetical protein
VVDQETSIMAFEYIIKSIPPLQRLTRLRRHIEGHYYSPIPSLRDIRKDEARIFDRSRCELPGVDLNESGQLALLGQLK